MHALACILSCDGCAGMPVTGDVVDSLTTMVNATNLGKLATGTRRMGKKLKGSFPELTSHDKHQTCGPSYKASISASQSIASTSGINPKPRRLHHTGSNGR